MPRFSGSHYFRALGPEHCIQAPWSGSLALPFGPGVPTPQGLVAYAAGFWALLPTPGWRTLEELPLREAVCLRVWDIWGLNLIPLILHVLVCKAHLDSTRLGMGLDLLLVFKMK